jgi:hypothetical protein
MITATITNIVLENNRFRVFVSFSNDIEETNVFMPESTSEDITNWVSERKTYHEEMIVKEQELKDSLIGLEI